MPRASTTVKNSAGPASVAPCSSPSRSARPASPPITTPTTTAPPTCHSDSMSASETLIAPAPAIAASTSGSASPSLEPDSSDRICRPRAGRSRSASVPVTTLEASTGSVGLTAAPNNTAAAIGRPTSAHPSAAETAAMPGSATSSSNSTGRQRAAASAIE